MSDTQRGPMAAGMDAHVLLTPLRENLAAARGPLPDAAMLKRIVAQVEKFA